MEPSGIVLPREYNVREDVDDKAAHWGDQLWSLLASHIAIELPNFIVDREDYGYIRTRLVNHLVSRLVVRAKQVDERTKEMHASFREQELRTAVDGIIDLPENDQALVVFLLNRIALRIRSKGAVLTQFQRDKVAKFARDEKHRCYLCGRHLFYGKGGDRDAFLASSQYRAFEVDHVFPQARGGSRGTANLAAICESCNKFKDSHLSFDDFAIEMSITSSINPVQVGKMFDGRVEFALLWRQKGECARCNVKFHDAVNERLYLIRRNEEDAYHFMNVEVACGGCGDAGTVKEGIRIRD